MPNQPVVEDTAGESGTGFDSAAHLRKIDEEIKQHQLEITNHQDIIQRLKDMRVLLTRREETSAQVERFSPAISRNSIRSREMGSPERSSQKPTDSRTKSKG